MKDTFKGVFSIYCLTLFFTKKNSDIYILTECELTRKGSRGFAPAQLVTGTVT